MPEQEQIEDITLASQQQQIWSWLGVIGLIYVLIVGVSIIGSGFYSVAGDRARELFEFATNPFAGLMVGMLATALIQSSSTVTSIIVGLVAGGLPVTLAVPMVMGSNIGTTITNTLVSLGHVREGEEFEKAFAAATIHDFFNLISVLIFLPLEIFTHFLEKTALVVAQFAVGGANMSVASFNLIKFATSPATELFKRTTESFPYPIDGLALILMGVAFIVSSIFYISKILKLLMVGKAKLILQTAIGNGPIRGIFSGTILTVLVQSSSTTTSLIVPLAGVGLLTLEEVYPFTLGANIGTCITALLAASAVESNQIAALEIAMVHLLYNLLGVTVIYGVPYWRDLPIRGARVLARVARQQRYVAAVYVVSFFFIMPFLLLGITKF